MLSGRKEQERNAHALNRSGYSGRGVKNNTMDTLTERELNLLLVTINSYRDSLASLPDDKKKNLPRYLRNQAAELEALRDKILDKLIRF